MKLTKFYKTPVFEYARAQGYGITDALLQAAAAYAFRRVAIATIEEARA